MNWSSSMIWMWLPVAARARALRCLVLSPDSPTLRKVGGSCDEIVGALAHRSDRGGSCVDCCLKRFSPRHALQRAGEHDLFREQRPVGVRLGTGGEVFGAEGPRRRGCRVGERPVVAQVVVHPCWQRTTPP